LQVNAFSFLTAFRFYFVRLETVNFSGFLGCYKNDQECIFEHLHMFRLHFASVIQLKSICHRPSFRGPIRGFRDKRYLGQKVNGIFGEKLMGYLDETGHRVGK